MKKTKTGPSTDADSLQKMADEHPIVEDLLRYREVEKLRSTYADALPPLIAADGRIHATFNQTATTTGRISSEAPNLQNVPVRTADGREMRRAFIADDGWGLLTADYSQIELRVLAHLAEDPGLIDAFDRGADVHTTTAAKVFGVDEDEVDERQRRFAKVVNYGLAYGMEAYGLGQRLDIPTDEARGDPRRLLRRLPERAGVHGATIVQEAKERGYTTTIFGRRRQIPELSSDNFRIRQMGERMAQNAPVQGTAADIFKLAMIDLDRALDDAGLRRPHAAHRARRARARGAATASDDRDRGAGARGDGARDRAAGPARRRHRLRPQLGRGQVADRLPLGPLGRVEGRNGIVEDRDVADVRPQPSVTHSLDDLSQLGAIGLDDEVDRQAVRGLRLGRPNDGHQRSSGLEPEPADRFWMSPPMTSKTRSTPPTSSSASLSRSTNSCAPKSSAVSRSAPRPVPMTYAPNSTCELCHHRPDCTGRAVREDALPRLKATVVEQSLPRGQARDRQARADRRVTTQHVVAPLEGNSRRPAAPKASPKRPMGRREVLGRDSGGRCRP